MRCCSLGRGTKCGVPHHGRAALAGVHRASLARRPRVSRRRGRCLRRAAGEDERANREQTKAEVVFHTAKTRARVVLVPSKTGIGST